ncbi:hypothetical protein P280DRAFT_520503 [Massarina eburnea CBS 473.64]|uniref:N-acetyltransferase domain-containing protein n=1 Tax=Massarina eburnea CBS 473.64 TaxID=1395130 RepID=A0A6A6RS75_9PLEO|nr:hypothetical protein P280DRAFT_520503 [Massarina eburnea CBS 473.64]
MAPSTALLPPVKFNFRRATHPDIPYIIALERHTPFQDVPSNQIPPSQYKSYLKTIKNYFIAYPASPTLPGSAPPIAFIEIVKHLPTTCPCAVCKHAKSLDKKRPWVEIHAMEIASEYAIYWEGLFKQLMFTVQDWASGQRVMELRTSVELTKGMRILFTSLGFVDLRDGGGGMQEERGGMKKWFL